MITLTICPTTARDPSGKPRTVYELRNADAIHYADVITLVARVLPRRGIHPALRAYSSQEEAAQAGAALARECGAAIRLQLLPTDNPRGIKS
jgi:hypothetical protein